MPQVEAQVWFVRANGRYASVKTLQRFMTDCGAALADWPDGRPYSECYDEAEQCLRAQGLPVPAQRPDFRRRGGGPVGRYEPLLSGEGPVAVKDRCGIAVQHVQEGKIDDLESQAVLGGKTL